jgi:hypothetical protein
MVVLLSHCIMAAGSQEKALAFGGSIPSESQLLEQLARSGVASRKAQLAHTLLV